MADYRLLEQAVKDAIKQNGRQEITGDVLQNVILGVIQVLGDGCRCRGMARPDTNPRNPDNNVFYFAKKAGTYTHFGEEFTLDGTTLNLIIWNGEWEVYELVKIPTESPFVAQSNGGIINKDNTADGTANGKGALSVGEGDVSAGAVGAQAMGRATDNGLLNATGQGSMARGFALEGGSITASGQGARAEGFAANGSTIAASGNGAHAEGNAEGGDITVSGYGAHAEGTTRYTSSNIIANGAGSHAEGCGSRATSAGSHAEGISCEASNTGAHAEGTGTAASGEFSHAEGRATIAKNIAEHAEGMFNASHKKTTGTPDEQAAGSTLSSIGCGSSTENRKNAEETMQNGDKYLYGVGGYDGTNAAGSGVKTLQAAINEKVVSDKNAPLHTNKDIPIYLNGNKELIAPGNFVYETMDPIAREEIDSAVAGQLNGWLYVDNMGERYWRLTDKIFYDTIIPQLPADASQLIALFGDINYIISSNTLRYYITAIYSTTGGKTYIQLFDGDITNYA